MRIHSHNRAGNVGIAIQGATVPGANGNFTVTPPAPQRRSRFSRRGLVGLIEDAFDSKTLNSLFSFPRFHVSFRVQLVQ